MYSLKNYDACFSFNSDNFICSPHGAAFRKNILSSDSPLTPSNTLNLPIPNVDQRPLWLALTGIVDPVSYTMNPQIVKPVWGSRIPCGLDQNGVPCQKMEPTCTNPVSFRGHL